MIAGIHRLGIVVALLSQAFQLSAQRSGETDPVRDALLAQVLGPSGCWDIERVDTTTMPLLDSVRLVRGSCVAGHGDTLVAQVALAARDEVFLLGCRACFSYLIRRNPPRLDYLRNHPVEYAYAAVKMMGEAPANASMAYSGDDLPPHIRRALQANLRIVRTAVLDRRVNPMQVRLTLFTSVMVTTHLVFIAPNGNVHSTREVLWRYEDVH